MIFYPNTYLRLLSDIPLAPDYKHTMTFGNEQAQIDYFTSKAVYNYDSSSYQRSNPKLGQIAVIRVPVVAEKLYNINYIMFRNNNFGTKWFYAFVTQINYINDGLTELIFELDIMQTWLFDYKIMPCMVEREHTNNDAIGANLMDEDLFTGPYQSANYTAWSDGLVSECCVAMACTFGTNYEPRQGAINGNTYNGLNIIAFKNFEAVSNFIAGASQVADGIVSIFMLPPAIAKLIFPDVPGVETEDMYNVDSGYVVPTTWTISKDYTGFDGYRPHNNKLYQYPYNFLRISTTKGMHQDLRYELFSTSNCQLSMQSLMMIDPAVKMIPKNYKGSPLNYNEQMTLTGYPQCSYVTDVYKMWLAQNASQIDFSYFQNAANTGLSVFKSLMGFNFTGAVTDTLSGMVNVKGLMAKEEDMSRLPPSAHTGNASADFEYGDFNFKMCRMKITAEYAKSVDSFFDLYGYKTMQLKVPNINGRKSWNYVKTIDANIIGNIPAPDLASIIKIFNAGITFWHTPDVGNYNLSNEVV